MQQTISQFAAQLGISASAVRYYEKAGLLPVAERRSGQRVYRPGDLPALRLVVALRKAGFSVAEIRALLNTQGLKKVLHAPGKHALKTKVKAIEARIRTLEEQRDALEHALQCLCEDMSACRKLIDYAQVNGSAGEDLNAS